MSQFGVGNEHCFLVSMKSKFPRQPPMSFLHVPLSESWVIRSHSEVLCMANSSPLFSKIFFMNSRFFLFVAYALLLTTAIQYFFFSKPHTDLVVNTDVILTVQKDSIVIPNIPQVTLVNNLTGSLLLKPCEDMAISIDSKPLSFSGIQTEAPTFCDSLTIMSGSKALLPFSDLSKVFAQMSGKYIVTVKTPV